MRHVCTFVLVASLCASLNLVAAAEQTIAPAIGKKVAEFSLQDFRGKAHALSDLKDARLVVVAFLGVECPLSKLYAPRLVELAAEYEGKGVKFLAVDPNRQDAVTEMGQFANLHQLSFPFVKDLNNVLADAMGAARVPQVFLLDGERTIRYAGRIDDQYGFQSGSGYAKFKIQNRDLAGAIDSLLAGKEVATAVTDSKGCLIGRVRQADTNSEVTYSNQIARIFQDHCVECHRPGQIGPFALQSYEEAAGWAEMIEETVRDQRMPPWHPDPKYGKFRNNLALSDQDKELIYQWVAKGAPEGDPKDLPETKEYVGGWSIPGGPDAVFYMTDEPVDVPAEGTVDYRYYVVDTGFKEDKWVQVAECMPDNRGVVHHIIVFMKPPQTDLFSSRRRSGEGDAAGAQTAAEDKRDGKPAEKTAKAEGEQNVGIGEDGTVGNSNADRRRGRGGRRGGGGGNGGQASFGQLCGFAPGTRPYVLPPGMAKLIPAGWQLVFQLHYTPNGSPQKDRSAVGIKFADPASVKYRVATANAANGTFEIPAGDSNYEVQSDRTYGGEVLLLSVFPHMHLRGKDFRYELFYPDGKHEIIMDMPRYDFNWQTSYVFEKPLELPAGTRMHCIAHFDNSADNPANPDPASPVTWGDQTWEEMMIGWFDIAVPKDTDISKVLPPDNRRFGREEAKPRSGEAGQ
ncbi:MAG: redoxin domain-containing protein [Pirellulales bacterium]